MVFGNLWPRYFEFPSDSFDGRPRMKYMICNLILEFGDQQQRKTLILIHIFWQYFEIRIMRTRGRGTSRRRYGS